MFDDNPQAFAYERVVSTPLTLSVFRREIDAFLGGCEDCDLDPQKYTLCAVTPDMYPYMVAFLGKSIVDVNPKQAAILEESFSIRALSSSRNRVGLVASLLRLSQSDDEESPNRGVSSPGDGLREHTLYPISSAVTVECKLSSNPGLLRFIVVGVQMVNLRMSATFQIVPLLLLETANQLETLKYISGAFVAMEAIGPKKIRVIGSSFEPRVHNLNTDAKWKDIFLDPFKKEDLRMDVEFFIKNRSLFEAHGIAYKRSYMLIGPPGNGKSMLVKVLASEYPELSFFAIDFDAALTSEHFGSPSERFMNLSKVVEQNSPAVVVLEDLDRAFEFGERAPHSIAPILQILDGVISMSGAIFIITANHPEKLDEAIILRKGRFDKLVVFDKPTSDQIIEYFTKKFEPWIVLSDKFLACLVKIFSGMSYSALASVYEMTLMRCLTREKMSVREIDILTTIESELEFLVYAADGSGDAKIAAFQELATMLGYAGSRPVIRWARKHR